MAERLAEKKVEIFCASFVLATLVSPLIHGRFSFSIWILFLTAAIFALQYFLNSKVAVVSMLVLISTVGLAFGFARYETKERVNPGDYWSNTSGQYVQIEGIIVSEPEDRGARQRVVIETTPIPEGNVKILLWASAYPALSIGDHVKFSGELRKPEPFSTDTGAIFDYEKYLRKEGIFFEINSTDVEITGHKSGGLAGGLVSIKKAFLGKINSLVREPESSLVAGMLFGVKNSLGDDLEELFRHVGLIHIVVLSGFNITIVAEALTSVFSIVSVRLARLFAGIGIILFCVMVGLSATVMRAGIMALLVLVARSVHRRYDVSRAFALTAFAMVLWNPFITAYDPSFELSFIATAGIIWAAPWFEQFLHKITERFHVRETLSATISTQICVLPLIIYISGNISLVSLPVNIFVLPLVPFIMLGGFVVGVLAFIASALAAPFAIVTQIMLTYVFVVSKIFNALPFSTIKIPGMSVFILVLLYLLLLGAFVVFRFRKKVRSFINTQWFPHFPL